MRFPDCHNFCRYYFRGKTCAFQLVMISACTILTGLHAVSGLSRFPHVQFLRLAYAFRLVAISAGTISAGRHALFNLSQFPHVQFSQACMRFPACHDFRTYYFRGKTCAFALIMLFACTISVGVHALFGSSRFPHILVTPAYMHFSACHVFRTYYFRGKTCAFALVTISARTIPTGLHAVSGLPHFPHIQFLRAYMRFRAYHAFRMYYFCQGTCAFALIPFSARTISAGVHAISGLSQFPQVEFLPEYMRFLACHNFRTYYFCQGTCDFTLAPLSTGRISAGVHAVSHLSRFSHILGTPDSASAGCNYLNCLNM